MQHLLLFKDTLWQSGMITRRQSEASLTNGCHVDDAFDNIIIVKL